VDYLIQFLAKILLWLLDWLKWGAEWIWNELMGAFIAVLNAIPVPGWLSAAPGVIGAIPPSAAFFLQSLQVPSGLAIIIGAYVIRFIIRRIPLVG
jgi:hypothetical protein